MPGFLREVRAALRLRAAAGRFQPTVLMYHSVGRNPAHFTVAPETFAAQMAFLAERGFEVVPLEDCVRRAMAGERRKLVALTFDDGYADVAEHAWPILHARGFPATVFLIAGRMGASYATSTGVELPLMDWDRARRLQAGGLAFGSHTMTHPKLPKLPPEAVRAELERSREVIGRELGAGGMWLCYPHGRHTPEIRSIARSLGYLGAVGVEGGHPDARTDRFAVPRAYMHAEMGPLEFEACLT